MKSKERKKSARAKKSRAKKKQKRKLLKRTKLQLLYDQIETLKPIVAEILAKDLPSRDDDNRLAIEVWKKQGMKESETFKSFKYKLVMNKITTPESIGRTRRLLQARYPDMQGTIYQYRKHAEEKVRERLRNQLRLF